VLILENAYYSVISPEGCAAILWKDRSAAPQAAAALRITARDLAELKLVDDVGAGAAGGAHNDLPTMAETLKVYLLRHLQEVQALPTTERLRKRYERFRCLAISPKNRFRQSNRSEQHPRPAPLPCCIHCFSPRFCRNASGRARPRTPLPEAATPGVPIGESWEIADRPGMSTVVANGPLAGRELGWLMANHAGIDGQGPISQGRFRCW